MSRDAFDDRIIRADDLAKQNGAASEMLKFYIEVARYQRSIYDYLAAGKDPDKLEDELGQITDLPDLQARIVHEAQAEFESESAAAKAGKPPMCPKCGALPQVALLRPADHAARKSFVCSSCHHEWPYHRILCPKCGEDRFESLPVFSAEEIPHIRVDACDTCRTYLLTVDLGKEPEADPIVDEIAAVALNMWAQEKGYTKWQPNLFGL
jgi:FdhE protein